MHTEILYRKYWLPRMLPESMSRMMLTSLNIKQKRYVTIYQEILIFYFMYNFPKNIICAKLQSMRKFIIVNAIFTQNVPGYGTINVTSCIFAFSKYYLLYIIVDVVGYFTCRKVKLDIFILYFSSACKHLQFH